MKSLSFACLIAAFLLTFIGCTKEVSQEQPDHNAGGSGNFYATIDGTLWKGDSLQQAVIASDKVTITGIGKTLDVISIILPKFAIGTYPVDGQSTGFALYASLQGTAPDPFLTNNSTDPSKAGGTVSITAIDTVKKTVSGTFQFKLYRNSDNGAKTVTNGVFNEIPYGNSGGVLPPINPPGGNAGDTLVAVIDSVAWSAGQINTTAQGGMLVILGISPDGLQSLGLFMPETIQAGTYTLDFNKGIYFGTYNPDQATLLASQGTGNLTISYHDTVNKRIKGYFSFVGKSLTDSSSAKITNGYFAVNY